MGFSITSHNDLVYIYLVFNGTEKNEYAFTNFSDLRVANLALVDLNNKSLKIIWSNM
jgi:hypothetical protein